MSQELLQITLNLIFNFFLYGILSQKSSWFPSCTVKYISQECHDFNFSFLDMEPQFSLILKKISTLANLNPWTKCEFTFKFLRCKLLKKGIQEKLHWNNIMSIKSTFLANWVIRKTKPNIETIHASGIVK